MFSDLRNFLWTAAGRAEPAANEVQNILAPIVKGLGDISAYKVKVNFEICLKCILLVLEENINLTSVSM